MEIHNRLTRFRFLQDNPELMMKEFEEMLWDAYRRGWYEGSKANEK